MYNNDDRRRIYWLIDEYLSGRINGWTFSNEFYYSYCLEIQIEKLSDLERAAFSELDRITSRYTDVHVDIVKYPGIYYGEEDLKQKVIETKNKLQESI